MQRFSKKEVQLFDLLNKSRLVMVNEFRNSENPSERVFFQEMIKIQYALNQCKINNGEAHRRKLLIENTINIAKIMNYGEFRKHQREDNKAKNKKYKVNWSKHIKKNDSPKDTHSLLEIPNPENQRRGQTRQIFINKNTQIQKEPRNKTKAFEVFKKNQQQQNDQKKFVGFVVPQLPPEYKQAEQDRIRRQRANKQSFGESSSAMLSNAVMQKNKSVRKKFVPPVKKPEIKQEAQNDLGQSENIQANPILKNLDPKLIEMILGQILQTTQRINWSQIAGLGFAKKIIHQMIVWPMQRPDIFKGLRAPPKAILLFGPPGTGKTMIGRAIASEAKATFFSITASSLGSKWVGQSQKLVKTLFTVARAKNPSVIFIDEIDSLLSSRQQGQQQSSRKIKTQFLVQLDGAKRGQQRVLVIGATNRPQQLDDAVRRRFIKRLYIPLPNFAGREQLIQSLLKKDEFQLSSEEIKQFAEITKGYSGHDLYTVLNEASMMPVRNLGSQIYNLQRSQIPLAKLNDCKQALKYVKPSVDIKQLQSYQEWNKTFGSYQFSPDELQRQQSKEQ